METLFPDVVENWDDEEYELKGPAIAQDHWHLKERVTGELKKTHPDRALAIRELRDILRLVQNGSLRKVVEADYKNQWDRADESKGQPWQGACTVVNCLSLL